MRCEAGALRIRYGRNDWLARTETLEPIGQAQRLRSKEAVKMEVARALGVKLIWMLKEDVGHAHPIASALKLIEKTIPIGPIASEMVYRGHRIGALRNGGCAAKG